MKMKKTFCRPVAAALAALLAIALSPGVAFADPQTTPKEMPIAAPESDPYVDDYEYDPDAPWLYYDMTEEAYYEEFEPWRAKGQTEDEYWDEYYKEVEREMRESALLDFGFTDTDVPNVIVNGQPLNFAGAKPLTRDGALMVPARAVLEALGAELRYDGKAKTLTAVADGTSVVFTAGERTVLFTKDGRTEKIEAAAAPFVDGATASAYVPLRTLTGCFGLAVYWDSYYKLADVVDEAALIAEIDADFTVLNALLQSELVRHPSTGTEKTDVRFTADLEARYNPDYYYTEDASGETKGDASLAGALTILTGRNVFDIAGDVSLTVNGFESVLGEIDQDMELRTMLDELKKGTSFEAIFDYKEAIAYLHLPILSYAVPLLDKKTWIEFQTVDDEIIAAYQEALAETEARHGENMTVGNLLYHSFTSHNTDPRYGGDFDRGAGVRRAARMLVPFLGDDYMETNGNVHTISLNRMEIFNVLGKIEEEGSLFFMDFADYADFLATVPVANYTLRIAEKDGVPASAELSVNAKINQGYGEGDEYIEFHCDLAAEPQKSRVDYSIGADMGGEGAGTFRVHADAVSAPTDKAPRTAPPAGSKIVSSDAL
ncbi:MAG: copper amine oxidase N-terminal domain-containing protein [Clostridiales Family XIII bacterium]|jgi:hypothetical protein|nr:copper amine oxidase N-terminal domain-containing protein [Clostridiales Family XIII bacterium]